MVDKGPCPWHTMVLYYGATFHRQRIWRQTQSGNTMEVQRLQLLKHRNLTLSGDYNIDWSAFEDIIIKINKMVDRHGPIKYT
jgi:hypothetical protein